MSQPVTWVVTTAGTRKLGDIQKDITAAGFAVEQVLSEIGCLIGSATEKVADDVRKIRGVADVSPEPPPIDIGPPDAPVS